MRNEQTQSRELLTPSFNRQNHRSLNITKGQQEALKSLKEETSIMILLADKGRAKMSVLIDSGPYQLLNKDRQAA